MFILLLWWTLSNNWQNISYHIISYILTDKLPKSPEVESKIPDQPKIDTAVENIETQPSDEPEKEIPLANESEAIQPHKEDATSTEAVQKEKEEPMEQSWSQSGEVTKSLMAEL